MSTVATDEKQTLMDELAGARALIERREYETALDRLDVVCGRAEGLSDAGALAEVRRLAQVVWRRAPRGSATTEHADEILRAARSLVAYPASLPRGRRGPLGFGQWTLLVVFCWLVVSVAVGVTAEESWLFSRGALIAFALFGFGVIALGVWLVGAFVLLGFRHHWGRAVAHWLGARARGRRRWLPVAFVVVVLGLVGAGAAVSIGGGNGGSQTGGGAKAAVETYLDDYSIPFLRVDSCDLIGKPSNANTLYWCEWTAPGNRQCHMSLLGGSSCSEPQILDGACFKIGPRGGAKVVVTELCGRRAVLRLRDLRRGQ